MEIVFDRLPISLLLRSFGRYFFPCQRLGKSLILLIFSVSIYIRSVVKYLEMEVEES